MEKEFESPREELTALRVKEAKEKSSLEFSRYKQDCRKRALDLAWEYHRKNDYPGEKKVTETAEFYYNWLINLPQ